jgi:energy-coupling factor transporter ATP-binding protein EcfA2
MTQQIQNNPFGVYVPRSGTRMPWIPRPLKDDHPLVPWAEESHTRQWVDVDHVEDQVKEFDRRCLELLSDVILPEVDRGHVVVVTGPAGMGKTTLIHQCIHLLRQRLAEVAGPYEGHPPHNPPPDEIRPPTAYVAMTGGYDNHPHHIGYDEGGQVRPTPDIYTAIRNKVVDQLVKHFPDADRDGVLGGSDVEESFIRISTLLTQQDALLLVVVPHLEWRDETGSLRTEFLRTCLKHARSRIVLFVEVSHQDPRTAQRILANLGEPAAAGITHLALGALAPEDTVKFVSARGEHPSPESPLAIPAHAEAWRRYGVRQLRKMCFDIAERQRQEGHEVLVTPEDLRAPVWDVGALARTPPGSGPPPRQHPDTPDTSVSPDSADSPDSPASPRP